MKSGLKRDAFMVKNGGVFNTPILISKAEMRKSLVPSRFQSIEKEPQLQYISYHNYGSYLVRRKGLEPPTYWFVASHSIQLSYRRISSLSLMRSYIIARAFEKCKCFFAFFENFPFIFAHAVRTEARKSPLRAGSAERTGESATALRARRRSDRLHTPQRRSDRLPR